MLVIVDEQHLIENYGDICPIDGEFRFENGDVLCSEHSDQEVEGNESGDVPFF